MGEVISLFPNNNSVTLRGKEYSNPRSAQEYLNIIKETLDEFDYPDILCAILDSDFYDKLDTELKTIVNCYMTIINNR